MSDSPYIPQTQVHNHGTSGPNNSITVSGVALQKNRLVYVAVSGDLTGTDFFGMLTVSDGTAVVFQTAVLLKTGIIQWFPFDGGGITNVSNNTDLTVTFNCTFGRVSYLNIAHRTEAI